MTHIQNMLLQVFFLIIKYLELSFCGKSIRIVEYHVFFRVYAVYLFYGGAGCKKSVFGLESQRFMFFGLGSSYISSGRHKNTFRCALCKVKCYRRFRWLYLLYRGESQPEHIQKGSEILLGYTVQSAGDLLLYMSEYLE